MNSTFTSSPQSIPPRYSPLPSAASPSASSSFTQPLFLPTSSLFPRRSRRSSQLRKKNIPIIKTYPSPESCSSQRDIEISLDLDAAIDRASSSVTRLYRTSESRVRRYLAEGADAFRDLGSSVHIDGRRLIFCCRPSSLAFLWGSLVWGFLAALSIRAVLWLWGSVREGSSWGVVRRDRSLGGREVTVGRRLKGGRLEMGHHPFIMQNPLSLTMVDVLRNGEKAPLGRRSKEQDIPDWWPLGSVTPSVTVSSTERDEYQRRANMLVRSIMDARVSGKDCTEDDMIQLRRICRVSGTRVSFDTTNARDSFYREAVNFVLNICGRASEYQKSIQIDGEDVHRFLAGLADNVQLKTERAVVLLRGAIAAKTRACFLQAWALEVQEKQSDAVNELSKIVNILKVFPLEDDSPEMEMVANGLKRNLKIGQREHLLDLFQRLGGDEIQRIGKTVLGLEEQGR